MTPVKDLQKSAIIVAGMHRSGASSLVQVLNLLGCDVSATLIEPNQFNQQGYWESLLVNGLNDEILNGILHLLLQGSEMENSSPKWSGFWAAGQAACRTAKTSGKIPDRTIQLLTWPGQKRP